MKPLKKVYEDLNAFYASLDILKKWMNSKKGHEFAKRLGREPLDQLIKRFQAPDIKKHDYIQKLNSYKYAVKVNNLQRRAIIVKDYDKKVKEMKKEGSLRLPKSLTKEDRMKMETFIVRDADGKAKQKMDRQGRLFWNKFTNEPVPVRKRKSNEMGLAKKCHMYELHKMAKWDRKNPMPDGKGLSYDLFPKELLAAYKTKRGLEVERVRNMLSERFYGVKNKVYKYRLFSVRRFTNTNLPGGFGVWEREEVEPEYGGYDFTRYNNEPLPYKLMISKLMYRVMHFPKLYDGESLIGLKLYDEYGNVKGSLMHLDSLKPYYRELREEREREVRENAQRFTALGIAA